MKEFKLKYPYGDDRHEVLLEIVAMLQEGWIIVASFGGDRTTVILEKEENTTEIIG